MWSKNTEMRKEQRTRKQETRLRRARIEKGWTLQEASKKVGVSLATYRRWEAGLQKPHLFSLDVLCAVFGMTKEELGFADLTVDEEVATEKDAHTSQETLSLEALLANWSQGIAACWQAYMAGAQADLERLLPTYFAHLTHPTLSPGPYQQQAAGGTQAVVYSQLAQDGNLYAAAQLRLASIFTAWKRPGAALSAYTEVLLCAHERV